MTVSANSFWNRKAGPLLWFLCFQMLITESIVSAAWPFPYSRSKNYVSDLGSVHCAVLHSGFTTAAHQVCSPLHADMNISFVTQGFLVAIGTVLVRKLFPAGRLIDLAHLLFLMTGIGCIGVGLAPNDVNLPVHYSAATVVFFGASIGMTLLGVSLFAQTGFRRVVSAYTLVSGIIALVGTVLIVCGVTLGLGVGGIERVAYYPFPIWLSLTGLYFLRPQAA